MADLSWSAGRTLLYEAAMATDPDPPDDPRGISGASIAVAGEPDFDRVIRFQPPTDLRMLRQHGPRIGVSVKGVSVAGQADFEHPLVGARVDLLSGPRFWEQNGVIAPRNAAFIDPFDLEILGSAGASLRRRALWDPQRPDLAFYEVEEKLLQQREVRGFDLDQPEVLSLALGSPVRKDVGTEDLNTLKDSFIQNRLVQLIRDRDETQDPIVKVALEQRIEVLRRKDWQGTKIRLLAAARVKYSFFLNGAPVVAGLKTVDLVTPWALAFWMGAWDNDALCGYIRGTLDVPRGGPSPAASS
jgi:hypothetical protein